MNIYTVTIEHTDDATEPDAFAGLHGIDEEAVAEFIDISGDVEIYRITTEHDIDLFLDASPGVIRYERTIS